MANSSCPPGIKTQFRNEARKKAQRKRKEVWVGYAMAEKKSKAKDNTGENIEVEGEKIRNGP